jgi:hypothetical protein
MRQPREREREKEESPFSPLFCLVRELKGNTRRWEKEKKKKKQFFDE